MKRHPLPQTTAAPAATATSATPATLHDVLDRLAGNRGLPKSRSRDLRSAVTGYAKVCGQPPAAIPLDLAAIRQILDTIVPARANVSAKRWWNLRSDLAAAIAASGLRPMLRTADVPLDEAWRRLLARADRRIHLGLMRFARWASLRRIAPEAVADSTIERFVAELDAASLVRNLRYIAGNVAKYWNALVALHGVAGLRPVARGANKRTLKRIPWLALSASFREDVALYLRWGSVPDPLDEGARARPLSAQTLRLQRDHIHSAVTAAVAAGIASDEITSLASLVEVEAFRTVLRHLWQQDGRTLSGYTDGVAITLIAVAKEWVKVSADTVTTLKALRSKLGTLPSGLTDKNTATLRTFDDPRLAIALVQLPERLWQAARRGLAKPQRAFIDLQTALAIDLLIHVPLRMQNLGALNFKTHLHWPQGRRRPALITFRRDETKNDVVLEYELPTTLSERLQVYRNEIAPAVIGKCPDCVFITATGRPRSHAAISLAIQKAVLRYLGVKLTPHQFRHLAAKLALDADPGAYEQVRQLLGHTSLRTTTSFYAGLDTRRAGRAHAHLILKLRDSKLGRGRRRRMLQVQED